MVEIQEPQKTIPQYTIRWMLGLTTGCAVYFSFVALAIRGHLWALGVSVAIGMMAVFMTVGAILFFVVWAVSLFSSAKDVRSMPDRQHTADDLRRNKSDFRPEGDGA